MANLAKYDTAQMFISYLTKLDGKSLIQKTLLPLLSNFIAALQLEKLPFDQLTMPLPLNKALAQALESYFSSDAVQKPADLALDVLDKFCNSTEFAVVLEKNLDTLLTEYGGENSMRHAAFSMFKITSASLSKSIIEKSTNYFHACQEDEEKRANFCYKFTSFCQPYIQALPQKAEIFDTQKFLAANLPNLLVEYSQKHNEQLCNLIWESIESFFIKFVNDVSLQKRLDSWIKQVLSDFIQGNTPTLCKMVSDKLNEYSDQEFVDLVETHVSNDLQMIRINGSLVGGIAGILLALITLCVQGACH